MTEKIKRLRTLKKSPNEMRPSPFFLVQNS
jgi:hypothetical protein